MGRLNSQQGLIKVPEFIIKFPACPCPYGEQRGMAQGDIVPGGLIGLCLTTSAAQLEIPPSRATAAQWKKLDWTDTRVETRN